MYSIRLEFRSEPQLILDRVLFREANERWSNEIVCYRVDLDEKPLDQRPLDKKPLDIKPRRSNLFRWSPPLQAFCILLLRTKAAKGGEFVLAGPPGSPAAALNYAVRNRLGWVIDLFGLDMEGAPAIDKFIRTWNADAKRLNRSETFIKKDMLPVENIEIVIDGKTLGETFTDQATLIQQIENSEYAWKTFTETISGLTQHVDEVPQSKRRTPESKFTKDSDIGVRCKVDINLCLADRKSKIETTYHITNRTREPLRFWHLDAWVAEEDHYKSVSLNVDLDPGATMETIRAGTGLRRVLIRFQRSLTVGEEYVLRHRFDTIHTYHQLATSYAYQVRCDLEDLTVRVVIERPSTFSRAVVIEEGPDYTGLTSSPEPAIRTDDENRCLFQWKQRSPNLGSRYRVIWDTSPIQKSPPRENAHETRPPKTTILC